MPTTKKEGKKVQKGKDGRSGKKGNIIKNVGGNRFPGYMYIYIWGNNFLRRGKKICTTNIAEMKYSSFSIEKKRCTADNGAAFVNLSEPSPLPALNIFSAFLSFPWSAVDARERVYFSRLNKTFVDDVFFWGWNANKTKQNQKENQKEKKKTRSRRLPFRTVAGRLPTNRIWMMLHIVNAVSFFGFINEFNYIKIKLEHCRHLVYQSHRLSPFRRDAGGVSGCPLKKSGIYIYIYIFRSDGGRPSIVTPPVFLSHTTKKNFFASPSRSYFCFSWFENFSPIKSNNTACNK